jgi:NAD(P)-dependent dehydrogenase (short-subunit alcohol dehydrogenase family)
MSIVALFKRSGPSGFGYGSTALQVTEGLDLTGKTFLLTGATSGLGVETVRALSRRGAHVIAAARSADKAATTLAQLGVKGTPLTCELSEPSSVRAAVASVRALGRPLDGIICNAGIMALPKRVAKYGLELQLLTNHLGHFILVTGLLGSLGPTGRIVVVSSDAHRMARGRGIDFDDLSAEHGYRPWKAYGQSKLANLLFARELARRFAGSGRTANALHPGVINTNLWRHMNVVARAGWALVSHLFMKSPEQGAATQTWLAASPQAAGLNGQYFADVNPARPSRLAEDDALAARLWAVSEGLAAKLG